ncbi:MAG: hypothetical protein GEV07_17160 [Streptosporangiales bacterium]|nr:hypothetical protein [Streptosporangiales bacterium]
MLRTVLLAVAAVIGVIVVGSVLIAFLKVALHLLFYVFIGALLVGGIVFVVGKVRGSLDR